MSTLLTARDLSKSFGTHTLFTGVNLGLAEGDRLGMIGPNGSGKSTLLKIIAGFEQPDEGELITRRQLRVAYVPQSDRFAEGATPRSAVVDELNKEDPAGRAHDLDADTRAAITLSRLGFDDSEQPVTSLSGGWRKRLAIARAVVTEPDLLLLDEPTNHLDLEGVLWLEQFASDKSRAALAIVFVTHDRVFLESAADRVLELSRAYKGGTFEAKGNYSEFVRRKVDFLEAQAAQQTALASKVRRDDAWLKQGIQGRQTRNKSQVQDASNRRQELGTIKKRNDAPKRTTSIDFQATQRKTNKLLATHNLTKSMGGKLLFKGLDLELSPGMRIGLMGTNGSGKTTLLRLLTGELEPDAGTVKPAAELKIVTFTQHRGQLDPSQTLREALVPIGDVVEYRGKSIHVAGWAKRFLFDASQLATPVGELSGGEQARVLIANLMLQPADVLILDEPTNDLDIPSLDVLEQSLSEFPGAILLVTHDRFMLGRLSTELLALDGRGHAKRYHSYEQWEADEVKRPSGDNAGTTRKPEWDTSGDRGGSPSKKKLTFKLQHELDNMESKIMKTETEVERLQKKVDAANPSDHEKYAAACEALGAAQSRVHELYERWAELEAMTT